MHFYKGGGGGSDGARWWQERAQIWYFVAGILQYQDPEVNKSMIKRVRASYHWKRRRYSSNTGPHAAKHGGKSYKWTFGRQKHKSQ